MATHPWSCLDNHLGEGCRTRWEDPDVWEIIGCSPWIRCASGSTHRRASSRRCLDFVPGGRPAPLAGPLEEAVHLVEAGNAPQRRPPHHTGFARRFAVVARGATSSFRDPDRLRRILTNPWRPVAAHLRRKGPPRRPAGERGSCSGSYSHTQGSPRFGGAQIAFLEELDEMQRRPPDGAGGGSVDRTSPGPPGGLREASGNEGVH